MRLFAAIPVPKEAHGAIARAAAPLQEAMGVRALSPSNWHITLLFLGEVPDGKVGEIGRALSAVEFAPFSITLSKRGAYPNERFPRAIWVGGESAEAAKLAQKVEQALLPLGFRGDGKPFYAHATVARSRGAGDIEDFLKGQEGICSFEVRAFTLMKSTLMAHEARYDVLREFAEKA